MLTFKQNTIMKRTLTLLCYLLAIFNLYSQEIDFGNSTTRALIAGISDYANKDIADLRFADRDAKAFYDFLRSKAGGEVQEENIRLLLNEKATQAAIFDALHWLNTSSQKDDKIIIYFSGHGDVEKQTLWQLGYLLTHDTPYNNYPNNAIELEYLNKVITTMSVGLQAKVMVILDACRSGKLAGADNLGPTLTAEQAAIQKANEIRILSCQSDQVSIESELWGGGRGVFSYLLINGLKGMADEEGNDDVLFYELKNYLRTSLRKSLKEAGINTPQSAVFVGQEDEMKLADVDPEILASVMREMSERSGEAIAAVETRRGFAADATTPSPPVTMTPLDAFSLALENGLEAGFPLFMENGTADEAVKKLAFDLQLESLFSKLEPTQQEGLMGFVSLVENENLSAALKQQIAIKLHDLAQKVINLYLEGDAGELAKRYYKNQVAVYTQYPLMLQTALQLLPEDHPLRPKLQIKYHYLNGVGIRLKSLISADPTGGVDAAMEQQMKALALDKHAPYVHNELGALNMMKNDLPKAQSYFETATELAPTWAVAHTNLCGVYALTGQLGKAKASAEKAIALKPDYFGAYINLGVVYEAEHDYLKAETMYRKARALNDAHYLSFERRAYVQLETTRYEEAERQFYEAEIRKAGIILPPNPKVVVMAPIMFRDHEFKYPSLSGPGKVVKNPKTAQDYFMTGKYYFEQKQFEKAEPFFNKAMKMKPDHLEVYYYLGEILYGQKRYEEAEICFQRLIKLRPEVDFMFLFLANVYKDWNRFDREEELYKTYLKSFEGKDELGLQVMERYITLLDKTGRYGEEEMMLWRLYHKVNSRAENRLRNLYSRMTEMYPNDANWLFKQADFKFNHAHSDQEQQFAIELFEKVITLDSAHSSRAYIHNKAGYFYLYLGLKEPKEMQEEPSSNWEHYQNLAIAHFKQAVERTPDHPAPHYGLASAYIDLFDYENALPVLESLHRQNNLNFDNRLKLADLLTRSGQFGKADSLLQKAHYMQPEPVPGLAETQGKWHLLQNQPDRAIEQYLLEKSLDKADKNNGLSYTLARLHARLGHSEEALLWLDMALKSGFKYGRVIRYDSDWDQVREREDFEALLQHYPMVK